MTEYYNNTKPLPSLEYLDECFEADFEKGILYRKYRSEESFDSKRKFINWNKLAGKEHPTGIRENNLKTSKHVFITLDDKKLQIHRVLKKMHSRKEPEMVDHEDQNPLNNSISNLIDKTKQENDRNKTISPDHRYGCFGISEKILKDGNTYYYAKITNNEGKLVSLGRFSSLNAAIKARKDAEICLGYGPNHGKKKA